MGQLGSSDVVFSAVLVFLSLAGIPVLDRTVITGDTAPDFGLLSAVRAGEHFSGEISVVLADGIGRAHGVVRQTIVLCDLTDQICRCFPVRQFLAEEGMEYGTGSVHGLQFVLNVQCGEDILRVTHRQVAGVGVIRSAAGFCCSDDIGEVFRIVFCKTIGGGLCRSCLQVVEIAVFFLIIFQTLQHVIKNFLCEVLACCGSHIAAYPVGVEAGFVHAHQTDGGEVVVEGSQIPFGVGIQAFVQKLRNNGSLYFQRAGCQIHHLVQSAVEVLFVLGQVGQSRHIDGDDTDRAGGFTGAEVAAGFLAELSQVQTETAAHGTYIGRFHIGIDVVGEIRSAVFCSHLKEKLVVLSLGPVKILGDGVGGNRILEAASVGIAADHQFDEGFVDHIHFLLAVTIGEVQLLAADNGGKILQVGRAGPVQRNVGEGSLGAPAGRSVDAVNEGLDALLYFFLGEVVHADKRSQISIKGGECLCTGPFVLHDAEEVDHLVAQSGQMSCRAGGDLSGNAAKAFFDELLQAPSGAVAGEHGQVMDVNIAVAVCFCDLFIIHFAQPVVRGNGAGVGQDQSADGIGHGGVLLHTPVQLAQIAVDRVSIIQIGGFCIAQLFTVFTIEDIGLGYSFVTGAGQNGFHAVLHIFHCNFIVFDLILEVRSDFQCNKVDDVRSILALRSLKCFLNRSRDLAQIKVYNFSVSFNYLIHFLSLLTIYLNSTYLGHGDKFPGTAT